MIYCRKCKSEMVGITGADNPNEGYAYNIYQCYSCDTICKHDVWKNAGYLWSMPDGEIINEREEVK